MPNVFWGEALFFRFLDTADECGGVFVSRVRGFCKRAVLLGCMSAVLSSCSAGAIACEAFPTDVPQGSSTYDMVEMFVQRGYIDLYEDNTFRGEETVSRYSLVTVLSRMLDDLKGGSNLMLVDELLGMRRLVSDIRIKVDDISSRLKTLEEKSQNSEELAVQVDDIRAEMRSLSELCLLKGQPMVEDVKVVNEDLMYATEIVDSIGNQGIVYEDVVLMIKDLDANLVSFKDEVTSKFDKINELHIYALEQRVSDLEDRVTLIYKGEQDSLYASVQQESSLGSQEGSVEYDISDVVKSVRDELDEMSGRLSSVEQICDDIKLSEKTTSALENMRTEVDVLKAYVLTFSSDELSSQEAKSLASRIENVTMDISMMSDNINLSMEFQTQMKGKLESAISEQMSRIDQLELEISNLNAQTEESFEVAKRLSEVREENATIASDIERIESSVRAMESMNLTMMVTDISDMREEIDGVQSELTSLKDQVNGILNVWSEEEQKRDESLSSIKSEVDAVKTYGENEIETLKSQLDDLDLRLEEISENVESISSKMNSSEYDALSSTVSKVREDINRVSLDLSETHSLINGLSMRVASLEDQYKEIAGKVDAISTGVSKDLSDQLLAERWDAESRESKMEAKIDELEAEVQLQRDFISNAEKKSNTATTLGIVGILVGIAGALVGIFLSLK